MDDLTLRTLEAHLDGALDGADDAALLDRLRIEPELADAVGRLRAERALRGALWAANEPTPVAVMRLTSHLDEAIHHARRGAFWGAVSRWGTTVAACILMGIWIGNSVMRDGTPIAGPSVAGIAGAGGSVVAGGGGDGVPSGYHVTLVDDRGQVEAVQRFPTLEQAREFANDFGQWQDRRQQVRQGRIQRVGDPY